MNIFEILSKDVFVVLKHKGILDVSKLFLSAFSLQKRRLLVQHMCNFDKTVSMAGFLDGSASPKAKKFKGSFTYNSKYNESLTVYKDTVCVSQTWGMDISFVKYATKMFVVVMVA